MGRNRRPFSKARVGDAKVPRSRWFRSS